VTSLTYHRRMQSFKNGRYVLRLVALRCQVLEHRLRSIVRSRGQGSCGLSLFSFFLKFIRMRNSNMPHIVWRVEAEWTEDYSVVWSRRDRVHVWILLLVSPIDPIQILVAPIGLASFGGVTVTSPGCCSQQSLLWSSSCIFCHVRGSFLCIFDLDFNDLKFTWLSFAGLQGVFYGLLLYFELIGVV